MDLNSMIGRFRLLEKSLVRAIELDDEATVFALDRQIDAIQKQILSRRPKSSAERQRQINFLLDIVSRCGDRSGASDTFNDVRDLIGEYLGAGSGFADVSPQSDELAFLPDADRNARIQELIYSGICFDSLFTSDMRISIIDLDGSYRKTSVGNANFYGRATDDICGLHVADLIGADRYHRRAKQNFESCFAGKSIQYFHTLPSDNVGNGDTVMSCEMFPFRPTGAEVGGAVVIMRDITMTISAAGQLALTGLE